MKFTTLNIDMVKSREFDVLRKDIQQLLFESINFLNNVFKKKLKIPCEILYGDSAQALFYNPEDAYLYFRLLKMLFYPVKIRGGIGIGNLDYDTNENVQNKNSFLDGECYRNARDAINDCKNQELQLLLKSNDNFKDKTINMMFRMIDLLTHESYKFNQIQIIAEFACPLLIDLGSNILYKINKFFNLKNDVLKQSQKIYKISDKYIKKYDNIDSDKFKIIIKTIPNEKDLESLIIQNAGVNGHISNIAEAINITKQTLHQNLKSKHYSDLRNFDATIYLFLKNNF